MNTSPLQTKAGMQALNHEGQLDTDLGISPLNLVKTQMHE